MVSLIRKRDIVIFILNSSLFYWFNWQYSNYRGLSLKDVLRMPFSLNNIRPSIVKLLGMLKDNLMKDLNIHSRIYKRVSNGILTEFDSFYPLFSKPIIMDLSKRNWILLSIMTLNTGWGRNWKGNKVIARKGGWPCGLAFRSNLK